MPINIPLQPGLDSWKHTNSQHLEQWLGKEAVDNVTQNMRDFYWPVPLSGVPGNVYAMPGGDFAGKIKTNGEMSAINRLEESVKKEANAYKAKVASHRIAGDLSLRGKIDKRYHAFASADAVYAAATGGKAQFFPFVKTGVASNAIGNCIDLWTALTSNPTAGAAAGAAPGGVVPDNASAGAFAYVNPASAGTGHFLAAEVTASVINNTLLLYDRIFAVAKTMNSTANEAVTGVPTRYQSTTSTSLSYAGGNFVFTSVPTTVLPATAHNWVAGGAGNGGCTYTDQGGTGAQNFAQMTGVSACVLRGVDIVAQKWYFELAAGDVGVQNILKMECSALVATGTIDFVIGHPIAFMPCPVANLVCIRDGLRSTINLTHIEDGACLALLEMPKPATTATTYSGLITTVAE